MEFESLEGRRLLALVGDLDVDNDIDYDDIDALVLAFRSTEAYEAKFGVPPLLHGDFNGDGRFDFDDVPSFVELLKSKSGSDQWLVNATISGTQETFAESQAVAITSDDGFVVAFSGNGPGDQSGVYAARFGADGMPVGEPVLVNQHVSGKQTYASVATGVDGRFAIVWSGVGPDDRSGVFARRFGADGTPLGDAWRVNSSIEGGQTKPEVAIDADGTLIVVWQGRGEQDRDGIWVRRFGSNGEPLGNELLANSSAEGHQQDATVAIAPDRSFLVGWAGHGPGDGSGIFVRRFDANGVSLAPEQRINVTTFLSQKRPSIGIADNGSFAVAWSGHGVGDLSGIFLRRFSSNGVAIGEEERVNSQRLWHQKDPSLSMAGDGSLVVVWSSFGHEPGLSRLWGISGQRYDASGQKVGDEFLVNSSTRGKQKSASVVTDHREAIVSVWSGRGPGDRSGVFARRLSLAQH